MSRTPHSEVLSDALVQALGRRRVKTAVFLTFQFDPGFFEEEILPLLFDQSFSHVPAIRLVQLEERIRNLQHLAVYYDRGGLTPAARPARLDYHRIGLRRSTGYFHPKNIFLLVENQSGDQSWDSLLWVTLSANLTESGWWRNVEAAYITEVQAGERCSFRQDMLDLISKLKQQDLTSEEHPALEAIRSFLRGSVSDSGWAKKQGRWLPQLFIGRTTLPEFLRQFIERDAYNLEIISPYFDEDSHSRTLHRLLEEVQPKAVRIFLPSGADGSALCPRKYFEQVNQLPRVRWGLLPEHLTIQQAGAKSGMAQRFVHAKVYRFWNQFREILFVGSVNLTAAAHSSSNSGNLETGMLMEMQVNGQTGWWLQPFGETVPSVFAEPAFEETNEAEPPCEVAFAFDWASETLTYFWDVSTKTAPQQVEVSAQNVPLFMVVPIQFGKWAPLPQGAAEAMKELLKSTSLVEVRVDGGTPFRVLVREMGMAHKPALFLSLSTEEILHYWSLLSPEQREQFITQRALLEIEGHVRQPISKLGSQDSMFNRFAGIFHAFGRLETHVRTSLDGAHETEAVYRLLGEKHDSLVSLLDKVIADEEADRVNRYVTLLCALQLVDHIERDFPEFKRRHRPAFVRVHERLEKLDEIEAGFSFETPEMRSDFFNWYREMFLKPARLPREETV